MVRIRTMLFAVIFALALPARAESIKVATGGPKGTYTRMFAEMYERCKDTLTIVPVATSGSVENVDKLKGNDVNAAFAQADVLFLRQLRSEDMSNLKTLVALHKEQIHVIALTDSKLTEGGIGIGSFKARAKPVVFQTVADLAGRRVAAAGGSAVTASVIQLQSGIPFELVELPDADAVVAAVRSGQVEAGLLVGGAPLGNIAALGKDFKLLAFPEAVTDRLKQVYGPARLSYSNLSAGNVPTIATEAVLVTRTYKTEKMTSALAAFRACVFANLDELKETTGTHPAWQGVTEDHGKWPWYDLTQPKVARKK